MRQHIASYLNVVGPPVFRGLLLIQILLLINTNLKRKPIYAQTSIKKSFGVFCFQVYYCYEFQCYLNINFVYDSSSKCISVIKKIVPINNALIISP